jgi:hypothetical protein
MPFPCRLPCVGEVATAEHACHAAARARSRRAKLGQAVGRVHAAQAEAELGQAGPCAHHASGPRRYCATGPREDSAQWHLIYIFLFSKYIQILVNSKICVGFI